MLNWSLRLTRWVHTNLAIGCARCDALLVQISTNEVFPGLPGRFYFEYDQPGPSGIYARSKLAGEIAVRTTWRRSMVVRVAWMFGPGGNNFPSKILAAAEKYGQLRVVDDEFGNPTYAPDAADGIARLIDHDRPGIYHLVNEGYTSRFEFAAEVLRQNGCEVPMTPVHADEWKRASTPPPHAVVVNQTAAALGIRQRPWQEALANYVHAQKALDSGSA
jgi:dTDP-4-dehydrorhamnose reductase